MQTATTPGPSIHERFLADHRRLDALFERLLDAFEADDRQEIQRIWTELEPGLLGHLEAEEKYLLPTFERTSGPEARRLRCDHEHFRQRLCEIGAAIDLHIVRLDVARALVEELRAHALEEDRLLYRWADEHLDDARKSHLQRELSALVHRITRSRSKPAG